LGIIEGLGNKPVNRANPELYRVHILSLRRGKGGCYYCSECIEHITVF
jgi:predicted DNA-binding protein